LRAARRPLTALAAPVSLPSGPAGAGRGGCSTEDGSDVGAGAGIGIGIAESGPVERVSDGVTGGGAGDADGADGADGAGGAGGAARGEAIAGGATGTWLDSGMPRLTGLAIPPVVPVVPASANGAGAGAAAGGWNCGVGGGGAAGWASCCCAGAVGWSDGVGWSGGACWYPAAG